MRPNPERFAAADKGEYIVEEIVDLKITKGQPILFVTKWKGSEMNTDSPIELIKDTEAFKIFVASLDSAKKQKIKNVLSSLRLRTRDRAGKKRGRRSKL